jgi:hypothetical protein
MSNSIQRTATETYISSRGWAVARAVASCWYHRTTAVMSNRSQAVTALPVHRCAICYPHCVAPVHCRRHWFFVTALARHVVYMHPRCGVEILPCLIVMRQLSLLYHRMRSLFYSTPPFHRSLLSALRLETDKKNEVRVSVAVHLRWPVYTYVYLSPSSPGYLGGSFVSWFGPYS